MIEWCEEQRSSKTLIVVPLPNDDQQIGPCPSRLTRVGRAQQMGLRRDTENGAGEGIRTLDPNLGKVVLYP